MRLDRRPDPAHEREAALGVADRVLEHVVEPPRAEVAEQEQPGAEGAGHARGEHAGPRDEVVAELAEALDRGGRGRDSLAAEHERLVPVDGEEDRRHLAAGPVQVRLDDLEHEPGRDRGVERVAAALEHAIPAWDASQCVDATIPKVPRSSGRVVNVRDAPRSRR